MLYHSVKLFLDKDGFSRIKLVPKNYVQTVVNTKTNKKAKQLKETDVIDDGWTIKAVEKSIYRVKEPTIINNLSEFYKEVGSKFLNELWNPDIIQNELKQYNIIAMRSVYSGLQIINGYGEDLYVSGDGVTKNYFNRSIKDV